MCKRRVRSDNITRSNREKCDIAKRKVIQVETTLSMLLIPANEYLNPAFNTGLLIQNKPL